ncbi:hypothetical protein CSQ94_23300 [Janthinobacterium sp. BJB312]|nr:hypothetical protein CSQ94_23300 [Janthinobacterium sp. BJB312]
MSTPIVNPTWAGPVLLTPIYLDALMVGTPNQTGDWAAVAVQYDQLGLRLGQPQPSAFEIASNPPALGIHLIWTVPSALRHGQVDALGGVSFPSLPNRWIVTRSFIAQPGDVPQLTAWVLESDYLGPAPEGTHVFPDPDGGSTLRYIGRRFDLSAWDGTTSTYGKAFLQAMGPGDPTYVAVYDNMTNVLAFHDDMAGAAAGVYSYSSCGWYATPDDDPLYGKTVDLPAGFTTEEQWRAIMDTMQWTVGNDADLADAELDWQAWLAANPVSGGPPLTAAQNQWPAQNLCHGFVYGLQWKGSDEFYPINKILDGTNPPTVAIGANAEEALSAWLAKEVGSVEAEALLLAFQQDMVYDYVDNRSVFLVQSQAARFATQGGGKQWVVFQDGQTSSPTDIPTGAYSVPLDPAATAALIKLNSDQYRLDADTALLATLKWQLYAAYWKLENYPRTNPGYGAKAQAQIDALSPQVGALQDQIAALALTLEQDRAALQTLVAPLNLTMNTINQARFNYRQDPVILLAGASQDTKFGALGYSAGDGQLFTRFTGQTIYAIDVDYTPVPFDVTLAVGDFPAIEWPAGVMIPKEMHDYWFETFLLDTNNAQLIAARAFEKANIVPSAAQLADLSAQIARQQTLAWNGPAAEVVDVRTIAGTAGLYGVPPAKLSVAAWTPPWAPIYLDWEIEWHPSAATPQAMLADWQLDELDFEWTGTTVTAAAATYTGRSILNGQSALGLQDKLNDFLNSDPNTALLPQYQIDELRDMAATIGQFDVLAQSMSGIIQQLIMQQLKMSKLSSVQKTEIAELLADVASYLPDAGADLFFPIHAGHFRIPKLQVVDAYGQILRGSQLSDNLEPIRSASLVTLGEGNSKYMQLTPRVTQPLRLDFRMVKADDDSVRSNSSDLTSAICGWVIPNHIDHSLVVFDPAGNNLGEVMLIDYGNDAVDVGSGLRWDAVPGSNAVLGSPPEFGPAMRHLNDFVDGILLRGSEGCPALQELLDVIDSSLWKVDPLGQPIQGNLAILLGRPIAMVRALVTLGVSGSDANDQSWADTGMNVTGDFTSVALPLRIGDIGLSNNGVMGYFLDDDYSCFYPYYGYDDRLAIPRRVMADRTLAPRDKLARMASDLAASGAPGAPGPNSYLVGDPGFTTVADGVTTHSVTMLVDPRGWMPAISGYLPVQWLSLPAGPVNSALNNMSTTFRTGPVLLETPQIQLPLPASVKGVWTWVERSGVTTWSESDALTSAGAVAALPATRPILSEGWLKLSGALGGDQA